MTSVARFWLLLRHFLEELKNMISSSHCYSCSEKNIIPTTSKGRPNCWEEEQEFMLIRFQLLLAKYRKSTISFVMSVYPSVFLEKLRSH